MIVRSGLRSSNVRLYRDRVIILSLLHSSLEVGEDCWAGTEDVFKSRRSIDNFSQKKKADTLG